MKAALGDVGSVLLVVVVATVLLVVDATVLVVVPCNVLVVVPDTQLFLQSLNTARQLCFASRKTEEHARMQSPSAVGSVFARHSSLQASATVRAS
jgi:hypothetical protein